MAGKEDTFEVSAEVQKTWKRRGAEPEVLQAAPAVQEKVRETLKTALQAQLAREIETLGGVGQEQLMIHGRTGVSNIEMASELPTRR